MPELQFEKQVISTLTDLRKEMDYLKRDIHSIRQIMEDIKLTDEENIGVKQTIKKIKSGDTSEFIPWKSAKKELGLE
ncbi:hypothetical protein HZA96_06270 [Candidatus Woesearchaeota archaeon]|nr:hypothetical protein [Candidatus Woesearchaeota archaeon]